MLGANPDELPDAIRVAGIVELPNATLGAAAASSWSGGVAGSFELPDAILVVGRFELPDASLVATLAGEAASAAGLPLCLIFLMRLRGASSEFGAASGSVAASSGNGVAAVSGLLLERLCGASPEPGL